MSSSSESQANEPFADSSASPEVRRIATELLPTFYDQLKHIAQRARARLGGNYTLHTTALVHEAYLPLRQSGGFADEAHFLCAR
jgi:ECF sigma factor